MKKEVLEIIEIVWEGPYSFKKVQEQMSDSDFGLYQIYGTHSIAGPNTLLYIGKVRERTFNGRLKQHQDWINEEAGDIEIFIGKIGGLNDVSDSEWGLQIDHAERLLIYYCSPPYNSEHLNKYGAIEKTLVLNFGKRSRLPYEVSTLFHESDYNKRRNEWKLYKWIKK